MSTSATWGASPDVVLYLIAVAAERGADEALAAAIDSGAIPADWHIASAVWNEEATAARLGLDIDGASSRPSSQTGA